jgi:hypothetical protein
MEIHDDDFVDSGGLEHLGDQEAADRIAFFDDAVLPGIAKIRHHGRDRSGVIVFKASTKTNKSMRRALTGLKVEWMMMQSRPVTEQSGLAKVSPSAKCVTLFGVKAEG